MRLKLPTTADADQRGSLSPSIFGMEGDPDDEIVKYKYAKSRGVPGGGLGSSNLAYFNRVRIAMVSGTCSQVYVRKLESLSTDCAFDSGSNCL